jgi:hypothetical protein
VSEEGGRGRQRRGDLGRSGLGFLEELIELQSEGLQLVENLSTGEGWRLEGGKSGLRLNIVIEPGLHSGHHLPELLLLLCGDVGHGQLPLSDQLANS